VDIGDGVVCAPDPTGAELRWPARLPLVIGAFMIAVVIALALQRHEFTSPNWGLAVLVAITTPWVLDMFGLPPMGHDTRFRYPVLVGWSVVVIGGVWVLGTSYYVTIDFAPFLLVMLIGEMTSTAGAKFGAVLLVVCLAGMVYSTYAQHRSGNIIWEFAFVIGYLGGLAYRTQTKIATDLVESQERMAAQAKEEERRHLAREIHDLIAHSLAVSMLHLSGARLALAAGDTDEATAALADAEAAGRSAMAEIHRAVGLLGNGADGAAPPTPCASDLPELVDGFRRAGLDVHVCVDGDLGSVPLAPGLTAYRLVQESLSNAVKHAPGAPVDLHVSVHEREVAISAVNTVVASAPREPSGGNGLRGMVERAALLGGTVVAGNGNGSWKVDARIPWSEPA
jgi:signal transduction histidine kinase